MTKQAHIRLTSYEASILMSIEAGVDPYSSEQARPVSSALTRLLRKGAISKVPGRTNKITEAGTRILDRKCPRCAKCGHREFHCPVGGCNHHDGKEWCDCSDFEFKAERVR